ncbi:hypothetical protein QUA40_24390 [Microcoleus sp. Pol11C3]|uniref:hypothetical protein n=1 Tax=Microcoleus sp. Pol11C3 TaxID=3055390 RepID=UPI002FCFAFEE
MHAAVPTPVAQVAPQATTAPAQRIFFLQLQLCGITSVVEITSAPDIRYFWLVL